MKGRIFFDFFAMVVASAGLAHASRIGVAFDNDVLYPPQNNDWNYTGGFQVKWAGPEGGARHWSSPAWVVDHLLLRDAVLDRFPNSEDALVAGLTSFTPHDLENRDAIQDDRPYASLLFASARVRRTDDPERPAMALSTELTFGILGLRLADAAQTMIHEATGSQKRDPQGWPHQISDGGEPTLLYRVALDSVPVRFELDGMHDWFQAIAGVELAAGYDTYGWAGGAVKAGWIDKDYGMPGGLMQPLAGQGIQSREHVSECYGFFRAGGYGVAYNALLQGQFRDSDVTVPADRVKRLVDEFGYGAVFRLDRLLLMYAISHRSAEFEGALAHGQFWGTVSLSYAFAF